MHLREDGCRGDRRAVPVGLDARRHAQAERRSSTQGRGQPVVRSVEQHHRIRDRAPPARAATRAPAQAARPRAAMMPMLVDLLVGGEADGGVQRPGGDDGCSSSRRCSLSSFESRSPTGCRCTCRVDDAQPDGDRAGDRAAPDLVAPDDERRAPASRRGSVDAHRRERRGRARRRLSVVVRASSTPAKTTRVVVEPGPAVDRPADQERAADDVVDTARSPCRACRGCSGSPASCSGCRP